MTVVLCDQCMTYGREHLRPQLWLCMIREFCTSEAMMERSVSPSIGCKKIVYQNVQSTSISHYAYLEQVHSWDSKSGTMLTVFMAHQGEHGHLPHDKTVLNWKSLTLLHHGRHGHFTGL